MSNSVVGDVNNDINIDNYNIIWSIKPPKFNLMAIVSSTFTDTAVERNILMHRILPELRQIARPYANISVCLVDLRWGLKDSSTNNHLTWISCANEITRCRDGSGSVFFISLQSEKYGYCPLPRTLPKDIFDNCLLRYTDLNDVEESKKVSVIDLAKKWYGFDDNSIVPEYVLKSLTKENSNEFWNVVLPELRLVFQDTPCYEYMFAKGTDNSDLIVGRSVTEYEFKFSMRDCNKDANHCIWFRRKFAENEITIDIDPKQNFCDTNDPSSKLKKSNLLKHMESFLSCKSGNLSIVDVLDENNQKVSVPLASYITAETEPKDEHRLRYEKYWYETASKRLSHELSLLIDKCKQWEVNGAGLNIPGVIVDEMHHHYEWCRLKCSTFVGREDLISQTMQFIYGTRDEGVTVGRLSKISGAIIGKSGSVIFILLLCSTKT
jgi:hypothetical protein